MSAASDRGRRFEQDVARLMRKKLGARVTRDKRSGAGSHQKSDINDYYRETGLHIEAKSHETIKIKEFYRQAQAGASHGQAATVVFDLDGRQLACLSFAELLDIIAERNQLRDELRTLKKPVPASDGNLFDRVLSHLPAERLNDVLPIDLTEAKTVKTASGAEACRNGHLIAAGMTKCLTKWCPLSSTYKAKKEKKR